MRRPAALRCAALLLLHALALATVSGVEPAVNPRGWKAAKEAERRAAVAPVPTVKQRRQRGRQPQPSFRADGADAPPMLDGDARSSANGASMRALLPASSQQTCSVSGCPEHPALYAAGWRRLAAATAASFVLGMLCGALLLAHLRRWLLVRTSRAGQAAVAPASAAASCVAAPEQNSAAAVAAEAEPACSRPAALPVSGAAMAAEATESTLAAAAAAARDAGAGKNEQEEGMGDTSALRAEAGGMEQQPAAAGAAVAAAVHQLVLQQSGASGSSKKAQSASPGDTTSHNTPQQQQQQQGEEVEPPRRREDPQEHEGGSAAGLAVAAGAQGGAAELSMLRPDDQADVAAAAQLVLTICRSMHVDPGQLSSGERLQLIYTILQAWQAQQARRHAEQMHK